MPNDDDDLPDETDDVDSGWDDAEPSTESGEDFEDDAGDWSPRDYREAAAVLFGGHEYFGDTAHQRYVDEGYVRSEHGDAFAAQIERLAPGASLGLSFYERGGRIFPRGFLTTAALAVLRSALPYLDFSEVKVTLPSRPRREPRSMPGELPPAVREVRPADKVDLRKYCTPVGDQGQTSRSTAFAWTHALEMSGAIRGEPFPRLASSFTMLQFQKQQGNFKDFRYAYEGGDGAGGTWEPGQVLVQNGTCRHDLWDDEKPEPNASLEQMIDDAKSHRLAAELLDIQIDDLKKVLSAGCPVHVSMTTGDAFSEIGRDGVYRMPERPKGRHGYHAMLCVGYVGNFFVIKNSWGKGWGDAGYCYVPKAALAQSEPELTAIVLAPPNGAAISARPAVPLRGWLACPRCRVHTPIARFCTECGLSLSRFCSECGAELSPEAELCERCGRRAP
jgi:hypothetical protein